VIGVALRIFVRAVRSTGVGGARETSFSARRTPQSTRARSSSVPGSSRQRERASPARGSMNSELLSDIWADAEAALRGRLGDDIYERWIAALTVLEIDESAISLGVANAWIQEWIEARYLAAMRETLARVAGHDIGVRLAVDPELFGRHRAEQQAVFGTPVRRGAPPDSTASGRAGGSLEGTAFDRVGGVAGARDRRSTPDDAPRLDDVVEGDCNRLAYQAARRVVDDPGRLFNPYFVFGGTGVGKSQLVRAIHAELRLAGSPGSNRDAARARFLSAERFSQHFGASAQDRTLRKFRETYRGLDALVLDDVQALGTKGKTQQELLYTIEALLDAGRQVVIASDRSPQELTDLDPALVNRFLGGLVSRLERPDSATRLAIARQHATRLAATREQRVPWGAERACGSRRWRGLVSEAVLELVAERIQNSLHDIVGAILRLDVLGRVLGRSPTTDEARRGLAELIHAQERRVDLDRVVAVVGEHFSWSREELVGRERRRAIAFARQVAMYVGGRLTRQTPAQIGKFFGGRDPSTVRSAQGNIAKLVADRDNPRARDVFVIIDRLES